MERQLGRKTQAPTPQRTKCQRCMNKKFTGAKVNVSDVEKSIEFRRKYPSLAIAVFFDVNH